MPATIKNRLLIDGAISLAAALVTPSFIFLLSPGEVGLALFGTIFLISALYAMAITLLADLTLPWLHCRVTHRGAMAQWAILVVALVVVSTVGCILATAVLFAANMAFPERLFLWQSYRPQFTQTLKLCVFITLIFGLAIAAYEQLRDRLAAAELKLRTEELERERAIKLATEARLASLQARIHPHFLFNTLNSISSLIPEDPERAERLIERMAALLRFSLDADRAGLIPLHQELKIVADYLEIEKARLGKRLRYRLETSEQLSELAVPPLAIQTLVENSIKYAVAPNREGGEIRVRADQWNGCLRIEVADTGAGFALESAPPGHGLDNLRGRLAVLFDGSAELNVSRSEGWTTVSLSVPA